MDYRRKFILKSRLIGVVVVIIIIILACLGIFAYRQFYDPGVEYFVKGIQQQQDLYLNREEIELIKSEIDDNLSSVKNRRQLKQAYSSLGYLNFFSGDYEESNKYFLKALDINVKSYDEFQGMLYMAISNNYYLLGEAELSQEFYEEAKSYAISKRNGRLLGTILQARVRVYLNAHEYLDSARELLNLAINLVDKPEDLVENYLLLAEVYMFQQEYDLMTEAAQTALFFSKQYEKKELYPQSLYLLAISHYLNERYDICYEIITSILENSSDSYYYYLRFPLLVNSYYYLEGYDQTIELVDTYEQQKPQYQSLFDLTRVQLMIYNKDYTSAQQLLDQVKGSSELNQWKVTLQFELHAISNPGEVNFGNYFDLLKGFQSNLRPLIGQFFSYLRLVEFFPDEVIKEINGGVYTDDIQKITLKEVGQMMELKAVQYKSTNRMIIGTALSIGVINGLLVSYHFYKKKRLEKMINLQNNQDSLTKTWNYEWLLEKIHALKGSELPIQMMIFDIEMLQKYNETYGYLTGNQVLKQTAQLLQQTFKEGWVTRYKGHQFIVVILNQTQPLNERIDLAVNAFKNLNIEHITNLPNQKLFMNASGSSKRLTKDFKIEESLRAIEQHLQIIKQTDNGNYIK